MIKKNSDLIILSILWIVSIYSVVNVILFPYEIGIQNYAGYGMLICISVLRLFKVKKIKTILGIFLVIGSLNVVQFTFSTITFFFKLTWPALNNTTVSFGFQPLSFVLLIFLITVNRSDFRNLLKDAFYDDPEFIAQKKKLISEKHYNELKAEKDSKLKEIVDNKSIYQAEYVNAAQRLMDERHRANFN